MLYYLFYLHVFNIDVFKYLTIVDIPNSLIVPDLGCEQNSAQQETLPIGRTQIDLGVGQNPLQVDLK